MQKGSAFALCDESGLRDDVKCELRHRVAAGTLEVKTSATASPSGFPFQVVQLRGTLSDPCVYESRTRICNIGHLAEAYRKEGGGIGFRCPGEPVEAFVRKGGDISETVGKICLCNGLGAAAGYGHMGANGPEPIIVTLGKDVEFYGQMAVRPDGGYSAEDVVRYMLRECQAAPAATA